jgi:hypothetical protein
VQPAVQPRQPSDAFQDLAGRLRAGNEPTLEEVALTLDADLNPGIERGAAKAGLDALAERADLRLTSLKDPGGRVLSLVDFLYRDEGFCGNSESYDDPRNSYMHQVLERRTGIPITLSIVVIEVARRLGIEIHGVSFPRHFLARATGNVDLIIDAFAGRTLSDEECGERLKQMAPGANFDRSALRPATALGGSGGVAGGRLAPLVRRRRVLVYPPLLRLLPSRFGLGCPDLDLLREALAEASSTRFMRSTNSTRTLRGASLAA